MLSKFLDELLSRRVTSCLFPYWNLLWFRSLIVHGVTSLTLSKMFVLNSFSACMLYVTLYTLELCRCFTHNMSAVLLSANYTTALLLKIRIMYSYRLVPNRGCVRTERYLQLKKTCQSRFIWLGYLASRTSCYRCPHLELSALCHLIAFFIPYCMKEGFLALIKVLLSLYLHVCNACHHSS